MVGGRVVILLSLLIVLSLLILALCRYERWLELKEELVRTMLRRQKYREAAVLVSH